MNENFKIIKRNGKKVPFNVNKVYLAIKGGFSDFLDEYSSLDVNLVYDDVCKTLNEIADVQGTITVERVSNIIESSLESNGYKDVCKAFRDYRTRRTHAREVFASQPQKLVKIVENLTKDSSVSPDKRENANVDGNSAMGTMLQFGSTFSKQYALAYMMDEAFVAAHNSGLIHVHDLDFVPMGTTTCAVSTSTITVMDARGNIKCVKMSDFDHLFKTDSTEPEWQIPEPLFVLGRNGWTKLRKVMRRRINDKDVVYAIQVKKGAELKLTGQHKVPVIRNGAEELVYAKDIVPGDELLAEPIIDAKYPNEVINIAEAVANYAPDYKDELVVTNLAQLCKFLNYRYDVKSLAKEVGATTSRQGVPSGYLTIEQFNYIQNKFRLPNDVYQTLRIKFYGSKSTLPLLLTVTPEIARFMGYIFGDGSVHINPDYDHSLYQIAFINTNDEIKEDFYKCVESIMPLTISKRMVDGKDMGYVVCGRLLCELFFRILGYKKNAADMRIPDFIMNGSDEIKYNFLSALIDTDGCISKRDTVVSYGSVCEPFIKQVLQIFNSLGIDGKLSKRDTKGTIAKFMKDGKEVTLVRNYDTWRITIPAKFNVTLYENLCSVKRIDSMKAVTTRTYKYLGEVVSNVNPVPYDGFVYDLETAEHWFVADGFVVHNCLQIPLDKLFEHGFNTGHGFLRPPKGIASYAALTCIAIQSNQNDQHGGQSIPLFDYYLAPGVLQTFQKQIKQEIFDTFDTMEALEHLDMQKVKDIADALKSIEFDAEIFYPCVIESAFEDENEKMKKAIKKAYDRALKKTDRATYQAMEALIHNLNTMHCLPASEKIWVRENGTLKLMTMEDIHNDFQPNKYQVISLNKKTGKAEYKYITTIKASGKNRTIYDITTIAGQKVRLTDNHKMMVLNKGKIDEALPSDVDAVLTPRGLNLEIGLNDFNIEKYGEIYKNTRYTDSHVVLTPELAELMGIYCADGSIVGNEDCLVLTVCDKIEENYLKELVASAFGCDFAYKKYFYESNGENKIKEYRFSIGVRLGRFLKDVCGHGASNKTIPNQILFADEDIKKAFLNGYFKCDGRNNCKYNESFSISEELSKKMQLMILSMYELPHMNERVLERHMNEDGPEVGDAGYITTLGNRGCKHLNIPVSGEVAFEIPKYDLSFVHELVDTSKLSRRHSKNLRYNEVEELIENNFPQILNLYNIPVKEKTVYISEEETYDISVEDNETFLTKDFIFVHNSRAGAQVPFSSVNFGTDTSPEGRMVVKNFLLAENAGLGHGETPIFPISIFKVKEGVNYNPEDPNYDLLQLSCKVTAKRLFPNFVFLDSPYNLQYYKPGVPETEVATMGCVSGDELISYKFNDKLYVEVFSKAYQRMVNEFGEEVSGASRYVNTEDKNVVIYDSTAKKFIHVKKFIKNPDKKDWKQLTLSNGRRLLATSDHPLPVIGRGRTYVRDIKVGDTIPTTKVQPTGMTNGNLSLSVDEAWLLGYIIGNKSSHDKNVLTKLENIKKGLVDSGRYKNENEIRSTLFRYSPDGKIPSALFGVNDNIRLAFLAGLIDCLGDFRYTNEGAYCTLNLFDKELALQVMAIVHSLNEVAVLGDTDNVVRFSIPDFGSHLSNSEADTFLKHIPTGYSFKNIYGKDSGEVVSIEDSDYCGNSYDVETESDMFDVSGICSHNCRTRVMGNVDKKKEITPGRGNLSFTTINLVRLGLEHGLVSHAEADMDGFYKELDEVMDLCKDQLLQRFDYQCKKHINNFPFLFGNGAWVDSDKLTNEDNLRKVLKHGTLSIGFIGLAECLKALIDEHHGESDRAQKLGLEIIGHMREKCDQYTEKYKLNFTLLATPSEGTAGKYVKFDRELFGVIPGVTDRDYYTNSNHIPVYYNISVRDKIAKEAPYHALCNAGHIAYIELDGLTSSNPDAIMECVRIMHDAGIGYGAINHPVDRDPVCGYTGIIGDECPRCGRHEGEGVSPEKLRSLGVWTVPSVQDDNNDEAEDKVTHKLE